MPLSFLWPAQVSDVFVLLLPLLSFFRFQGFAHAVENAVFYVASSDIIPALVAVVVTLVFVVDVSTFAFYCCCCCCKRNFSCWRRSSTSSCSCSNSNWCSRSRCSVSFFVLRFLSSISSICRLLDDRKLAILVCFLLPCVAECLEETSTFSCLFFVTLFPVSISFVWVFITSRCG